MYNHILPEKTYFKKNKCIHAALDHRFAHDRTTSVCISTLDSLWHEVLRLNKLHRLNFLLITQRAHYKAGTQMLVVRRSTHCFFLLSFAEVMEIPACVWSFWFSGKQRMREFAFGTHLWQLHFFKDSFKRHWIQQLVLSFPLSRPARSLLISKGSRLLMVDVWNSWEGEGCGSERGRQMSFVLITSNLVGDWVFIPNSLYH